MIEAENINRRSANFQSLTAHRNNVLLFSRLVYRDLILIRQAYSYYGDHIRFHGGYRIEFYSDSIDTSEYNLRGTGDNWRELEENNNSSRSSIVEYCCNCLVGRRTVGCCTHVMWYLGWTRHDTRICTSIFSR